MNFSPVHLHPLAVFLQVSRSRSVQAGRKATGAALGAVDTTDPVAAGSLQRGWVPVAVTCDSLALSFNVRLSDRFVAKPKSGREK